MPHILLIGLDTAPPSESHLSHKPLQEKKDEQHKGLLPSLLQPVSNTVGNR
jgi:hypothetical protein